MKIFDAFLFFQELDLLEIRLNYLDKYVDKFLIIEACQTFSGNPKKFIFERNTKRFAKFLHKIEYYKINDFHHDYASVQNYLSNSKTLTHKKISQILNQHNHYSKEHLNWVLDSYHRECIHFPLHNVAGDDDIVFFSDLDEIPSKYVFSQKKINLLKKSLKVCKQKEFRYFLNYYKDSQWLGSIGGKYKSIKNQSLNMLRIDSKKDRKIIHKDVIPDGGYHFTSCGDISLIKEKIKSWGHQEFNNHLVYKNIEKNIMTGQDIFQREVGTNLTRVDILDKKYFDKNMSSIASNYIHLISMRKIKFTNKNAYSKFQRIFFINASKLLYKILLMTKKFHRK
jgi:beta-1,4-mannosyl-glycoprotein beta-1,4-N-acetylglucosaminyltransferase